MCRCFGWEFFMKIERMTNAAVCKRLMSSWDLSSFITLHNDILFFLSPFPLFLSLSSLVEVSESIVGFGWVVHNRIFDNFSHLIFPHHRLPWPCWEHLLASISTLFPRVGLSWAFGFVTWRRRAGNSEKKVSNIHFVFLSCTKLSVRERGEGGNSS